MSLCVRVAADLLEEGEASQGQTEGESEGHLYRNLRHRVMETHVELLRDGLQQHPSDDPVRHGGSRFPLVGPVLRFTLEQDPVFFHRSQTPTTALRPVCCPPTLQERKITGTLIRISLLSPDG